MIDIQEKLLDAEKYFIPKTNDEEWKKLMNLEYSIPVEGMVVESIHYYGSPNLWSEDKIQIHEPDGTVRKCTSEELRQHYEFINNKIGSGSYHG